MSSSDPIPAISVVERLKAKTRSMFARRANHQPEWRAAISASGTAWQDAVRRAKGGPRVLIATGTGGYHAATHLESLLAIALTLRGAEVHLLLCDEFLPACMQAQLGHFTGTADYAREGPARRVCPTCWRPGRETYRALGLPLHRYSESTTATDRATAARVARELAFDEIREFRLEDIAVGEHALAGALRFFAKGTLGDQPDAEPVLRRYLEAALLTTFSLRGLLARVPFAAACFHHGIYVPQGLVGEVARAQGVRVVNWNPAYRKQCFIFSHGDTYHHTLMNEPVAKWEDVAWTAEIEEKTMGYLASRWHGTQDWIWFHEKPQFDLAEIQRQTGLDFSRPIIGLLTNVIWDAQLHYPANAFPNMIEWIMWTIAYFAKRPELQLLIRVHPAEIRGTVRSRQTVVEEIARAFPVLPPNVVVVPPESEVSTYAAMAQCDSVIIYGTKTGVELTSQGKPVIVAGEAWIRNKGVTRDADSIAHYGALLDELPYGKPMTEAMTARARKYAYHFFFRRMIPLEMMQPHVEKTPYKVTVESLDELLPGRHRGLDVICDGILRGADFIYPDEDSATAPAAPLQTTPS